MNEHTSRGRFEMLVAAAMDAVPEPFATALDEVAVVVEARSRDGLYGRYDGFALTSGGTPSGSVPSTITIYVRPLADDFPEEDRLVEQVRVTLLHELGHHLGMDEDDLSRLGYA